MKFTANCQDLLFELESAVSSPGAENISSSVAFLPSGDSSVTIRSCSLDYMLFLDAELQVRNLDPRAPVSLRVKKLSDILKSLDGDTIEIATKGTSGSIRCGNYLASGIDGVDGEIPIPTNTDGQELRVHRPSLNRILAKVMHAVDANRKSAWPNVILKSHDGMLYAIGTFNNHQVSIASTELDDANLEFEIAVPVAGIRSIISLPGGDEALLCFSPGLLVASAPGGGWRKIYCRLLDQKFTDYLNLSRTFLSGPHSDWTGDREALLALLWRIEAVAGAEAPVDLAVAEDGTLGASWASSAARAVDEIPGVGGPWSARCNLSRLLTSVKATSGDTVSVNCYPNENSTFLSIVDFGNPSDVEIVVCMHEVNR